MNIRGAGGAILAAFANSHSNFPLYCIACFLIGICIASVQFYVFSASEIATNSIERRTIIALITGCGFLSAFLGSNIIHAGRLIEQFDEKTSAFLLLVSALLLAAINLGLARYPKGHSNGQVGPRIGASGWSAMVRKPIKGMILSAAAFANMTLLMHATPIAMGICGLGSDSIATVLQWHFIAMYAPAIITGIAASRLTPQLAALIGILVGFLASMAAYFTDPTVGSFMLSLVLCGISWGLVFPAGTALMIEQSDPDNRVKIQGLATLLVYGSNCLSSFSTGPLVQAVGWTNLSLIALMPLCIGLGALMATRLSTSFSSTKI